ncbi:hypothetical protein ACFQ05_32785 [Amycolatopsis umgeniensis]|uniref:Uncharacterized protein n=1 Tax=Amycolatopsis umgeniensis TaxID=336628 RepID=A0A841AW25_9PSEU|nr:hypothetical protein [Amycolatopsis umgeniensis]MBB5850562.1 hypothetical protein [Amycolatopsis umgeniensis]
MRNTAVDTVRSLFAESGVDTAVVRQDAFVIDRFDNWSNQPADVVFGCFTGACCVAPPLAEAC